MSGPSFADDRVLAAVRRNREAGITPRALLAELWPSLDHRADLHRVQRPLRRLHERGLVRREGATSARRYYPAS